jgi:hypothetical protein
MPGRASHGPSICLGVQVLLLLDTDFILVAYTKVLTIITRAHKGALKLSKHGKNMDFKQAEVCIRGSES